MKKAVTILFAVIFSATINAQTNNTNGQVVYEIVRKLELKIQGGNAEQFQNMIPKERKSQKELLFNTDASLYQTIKKSNDEDVVQESSGGAGIMIKMQEPNEIIFCDLKTKINFEQREFMSRTFLIENKTDTIQWKFTGNQKAILGYNCMEAELIGSKRKTMAWFTPMIPVSTGPDGYVGLPGLILSMDIDEGRTTYTALSVDLKEIDPSLMVKPKEGKKVTKKEFNKIVQDKRKEMNNGHEGEGHSNEGQIIIRTI